MSCAIPQAVILCGGVGRRMRSLLGDLPKALAPLQGRPLLSWLLDDLSAAGVQEVVLVGGLAGTAHEDAVRRFAPPSLRLVWCAEPSPRGTAGALWHAATHLAPRFFLLYGDVFSALDWGRLGESAVADGGLATLALHRSDHPWDSDVVRVDSGGRVVGWRRPGGAGDGRAPTHAEALLGNSGARVLSRDVLRYIPRERPADLDRELFPWLIGEYASVFGYVTSEYLRDTGTPGRLTEVAADLAVGRVRARAALALIDRDGTLVEEPGGRPALTAETVRLLPGAARAVRRLNGAGVRVVVVTNQAAVARGRMSETELDRVHARIRELLAEEGAHLDDISVCPHHPETFHEEGRAELRGPCRCRKPATGLVEDALAAADSPPWRAVVIGDRTSDLQLAHNSALASIAVATGGGCRDGGYPARPTWRFSDLSAAAEWIANDG